ncbi:MULTISPECIES: glycosyltransferase [unclassified Actinobaculum]|uniref:glycosyltransferase n=1 Tax=unclassified Actinobaculum TaxID=2609299 RepID=UPI000D526B18|nr:MULTISPECIES: glycosyltransferase [unclassified Actinobaculum]AWE41564.1 glycosyl transferase [Actinobaculum sp. 313]RTE49178.1 glycosyltransferase [Actinobaculum sp. 352]
MTESDQNVAVVIPAKDEADRIEATIRAARTIPHVDLVVVVDDGSSDNTQEIARAAGATTVRHSANRGKAAAMESGAAAVAMRDREGHPSRLLLFIDADLGDSATETAPLVEPVARGVVDCTIAALPPQEGAGGHGFVVGLARTSIERATGWTPRAPLSGQRCLTRAAFEAALPLAAGWGVEVGMTIDLLVAGYTLQEVECNLRHRATANDLSGQLHRAYQYKDVRIAVAKRRLRRVRVAGSLRHGIPVEEFQPFNSFEVPTA